MKINERTLVQYANTRQVPDMEGWLYKRGEVNKAFQKRWCTLRGNLLFYAEKKGDKEPLGVIILEGCTVELAEEETEHFAFKLVFHGDGRQGRMYVLGASSQQELEKWMKLLACASYDFMKLMVVDLQHKIKEIETQETPNLIQDPNNPPAVPPRATRQNPFNSAKKERKTWQAIHNQFGAQIMKDREDWLISMEKSEASVLGTAEAFENAASALGTAGVEMTGDKLLVVL